MHIGNAFQPLILEAKGNASTEKKFQLSFQLLTVGILFQVLFVFLAAPTFPKFSWIQIN